MLIDESGGGRGQTLPLTEYYYASELADRAVYREAGDYWLTNESVRLEKAAK